MPQPRGWGLPPRPMTQRVAEEENYRLIRRPGDLDPCAASKLHRRPGGGPARRATEASQTRYGRILLQPATSDARQRRNAATTRPLTPINCRASDTAH